MVNNRVETIHRIVIFGNSGSGKSTYAKQKSASLNCPHMDLDSIAWDVTSKIPKRRDFEETRAEIQEFMNSQQNWVIEGCYADLLQVAIGDATEIVFLNPGVEICIENARNRPWEPHKYATKAEQDANLEMLIEWIKNYSERSDEFSYSAHRMLFDAFSGKKVEYLSNLRDD